MILFFVSLLLPTANSQHRPEIHCKHFLHGYPYGTPPTNDLIIRSIYALSSNDSTKLADWVAYRLDRDIISGPQRTRNWAPAPWLDESETLEPSPRHGDYKDAYGIISTDRGHQAPLGSFDGSEDWYQTNYLSNITPQKSPLNRGPWSLLEAKVRDMVEIYGVIYVMTGPLYEREMPSLPNADEVHLVPSGYWKIVLYSDESDYIQSSAFILDQESPSSFPILDALVTIDEVERRSGLDFLWELPDAVEDAIESNLNMEWAEAHF
ncbi:MAG: endonuclease [Ectothiorhodospiraceae bacterium]|nr:endonuclease [Ectothiorhodospiraceae bacterium]